MANLLKESFAFLKINADLATDFISYLIDINKEDYIAKLGGGLFPKEVLEDTSENSFISVLEGSNYNPNIPRDESVSISVVEYFFADKAFGPLWLTILKDFGKKDDSFFETNLIGKVFDTNLKIPKEHNQEGFIEFLNKLSHLKSYSFNFNELDDSDDKRLEFEKVLRLYKALSEAPIVLEEVEQGVLDIMNALRALYSEKNNARYVGLLLPNGMVSFSSTEKRRNYERHIIEKQSYFSWLSNTWYGYQNISEDTLADKDITYIFDEVGQEYDFLCFPMFHFLNLSKNKDDLEKELLRIERDLKVYLSSVKNKNPANYLKVYEILKKKVLSCLLVLDVNKHTIQLRSSLLENREVTEYFNGLKEVQKSVIVGAEIPRLLANQVNDKAKSVQNMTIIYSDTKFQQEVLFAHTLYEGPSAIEPRIDKPVVGVKLDGSPFIKNVFEEMYTAILAGARSGKGTLTMSLLAPLLSEGCPIYYLDYKPDIASLFWDLEKKYKENGKDVHFLAIDGLAQSSSFIQGEVSVNPRGIVKNEFGEITNILNVPNLNNSAIDFKLIRYYKFLQLLFLAGELQANYGLTPTIKQNYVFIDEITRLSSALVGFHTNVNQMLALKDKDSLDSQWGTKLANVIMDVDKDTNGLKTMPQNQHNFKFIMIGQTYDTRNRGSWGSPDDTLAVDFSTIGGGKLTKQNTFIFRFLSKCGSWLSGREQNAIVQSLSADERNIANKTGSFIYHKSPIVMGNASVSKETNVESGELFRSYFALVRNDISNNIEDLIEANNNGTLTQYLQDNEKIGYTNQFLFNRNKDFRDAFESISYMYDLNTGTSIQGVGFDGLFEEIATIKGLDIYSDEFIEKLNAPYDRLKYILDVAGIFDEHPEYDSVESYLYDCGIDGLYTKKELSSRFIQGFKSGGKYIAHKGLDVSRFNLSDDDLDKINGIEQGINEQLGDEEKTVEEKQAIIEDSEKQKEDTIKEALYRNFKKDFNQLKGKIGLKIVAEQKKIFSAKKDVDIFNSTKESVLDLKESFISSFDILLEPLKAFDDLRNKCSQEIIDFVNGKYAPIENLTFEDVSSDKGKAKSGGVSSDDSTPVRPTTSTTPSAPSVSSEPPTSSSPRMPTQTAQRETKSPESNGTKVVSSINTDGLSYSNSNGSRNLTTLKELTNRVIEDVKYHTGGDIFSVGINANGSLIINDIIYQPDFGADFEESLKGSGFTYTRYKKGDLGAVVNYAAVIWSLLPTAQSLSIENAQYEKNNAFWLNMGVKNFNYPVLFKKFRNLNTINVCGNVYDRFNNNSNNMGYANAYNDGGGMLSRLFGLNRNSNVPNPNLREPKDGVVENIFNSKPMRVMGRALGWTLGVKAVMLGATIFGGWGLLFGAFAAVGAYNESKNGNQQNGYNGNYNQNYNQNYGPQGGQVRNNSQNGGKGKKKNKNNQNRNNRNGNNGGYNPMNGQGGNNNW